jgi:hypothetical protein
MNTGIIRDYPEISHEISRSVGPRDRARAYARASTGELRMGNPNFQSHYGRIFAQTGKSIGSKFCEVSVASLVSRKAIE